MVVLGVHDRSRPKFNYVKRSESRKKYDVQYHIDSRKTVDSSKWLFTVIRMTALGVALVSLSRAVHVYLHLSDVASSFLILNAQED